MADHSETFAGRQYPLIAVAELSFADLSGSEDRVFELPAGAVITGYSLQVTTAFDGTTPTVDVGLLNGAADCLIDGVTLAAIEAYGESLFGGAFGTTNGDGLDEATTVPTGLDFVTITMHETDTTLGALRLIVEYVVPNRSQENQG